MTEVEVRVQLFAKAKELAGGASCVTCRLAAGDTTITSEDFLNKYLFEAVPALRALAGSAILAVEDAYVEPQEVLTLSAKSDIALIPPISGG
ncbi:hypothetical protein T484DRAFT_1940423 [Baffinella frigidus]|nr:hypothetical protein T484DRAFT_1940423 [Cryptophyta sp. CCMP2293]|mmetsp:Transcript_49306/g.117322  ORF Transcript_49306/g.117322 Transcript_49306/m.117322 type:complete len:92 (+) Transcript_49306:76-351(+)